MTKQNEEVVVDGFNIRCTCFRIMAVANSKADAHAIAHALNSQAGLIAVLEELTADGQCYCADWVATKRPCGYCKARSAIQGAKGG